MFRIVCDPSSGITELCLTEITLSGSQIFFECLVGVWQRNFEPTVCVCTVRRSPAHRTVPKITAFWTQYPNDTREDGQSNKVKKEKSVCPTLYFGGHRLDFLRSDRLSRLMLSWSSSVSSTKCWDLQRSLPSHASSNIHNNSIIRRYFICDTRSSIDTYMLLELYVENAGSGRGPV